MGKLKRIVAYPNIGLIILAYIAFIALGMPDGLVGVAWPSIQADFSVPLDAMGVLITASTAGYLISSFLSGMLVTRWGIGKTLSVSCAITGAALLTYTFFTNWWMIVLMEIVSGLGAGAIDAGLNNYVDANFSDRLMQWLHASYGIGITLGPIIMTLSLSELNSWRIGYRVVAFFQLLLAACFLISLPLWELKKSSKKSNHPDPQPERKASFMETFKQPQVWLSMVLFFIYVSAEVSIGTWTYTLLTESRGIDKTLAGYSASSFWATFTIGRILGGISVKKLGLNTLIQGGVAVALLSAVLLIWNPSEVVNLLAVALMGLAIAPIFPSLMSSTSKRVGSRFTTNTIGIQIAASGLGSVIIPSLLGILARRFSLEVIPVCMVIVFLFLFCLYRLSIMKKKNISRDGSL